MDSPPVRYTSTMDGYSIAYTVSGKGRPLLCTPLGIFNHVELDWRRPESMQPLLRGLAEKFQLIHFDSRGQGLSTRGLPENFEWDDSYRDLEAVVEDRRPKQFVLLSGSIFAYTAVRYAVEHPDRVRALVLTKVSPATKYWHGAYTDALPNENWELFLRSWPAAGLSPAETEARIETLRQTITIQDYRALMRASWNLTDMLPRLQIPTLVLHPRGQALFKEEHAIAVAAAVPNSRLVIHEGGRSVFGDTAAALKAIDVFLAEMEPAHSKAKDAAWNLPPRQLAVLRLIADGKSNVEIADELAISPRTVERHASELYARLGVRNRVEAAACLRDFDAVTDA